MIDSYSFGSIEINGRQYGSDVIIYPRKVEDSWWRESGHNLCLADIKEILDFHPDILVIGTGKSGFMKVPDSVQEKIRGSGIELFVSGTDKAVRKYNDVSEAKNTVAALHLTC